MTSSSLWVLVEHEGGELDDRAGQLCSEGRRLAAASDLELWAVLLGQDARDVAGELGRFGVARVLLLESEGLSDCTAEPLAERLTDLVRRHEPAMFLFGATPLGTDLAPRLASSLSVGFVPDCVYLTFDDQHRLVMTRPICGDQVYAHYICPDSVPTITTLRLGAFPVQEIDGWRSPDVELIEPEPQAEAVVKVVIGLEQADPRSIELGEAEVIVAAGRGVQQAEGFEQVQRLADLLEAPLAGSRPLIDLRLIVPERQVGQTGVTVAPRLYLACGISGAPQHTMGMKDSEVVVAIDVDDEAPIFGLADLQVVGDLGPIVAALNERLSRGQA